MTDLKPIPRGGDLDGHRASVGELGRGPKLFASLLPFPLRRVPPDACCSCPWRLKIDNHERELCEQLGVSRTPLRGAIRPLVAEGLVVSIPAGAHLRRHGRKTIFPTRRVAGSTRGSGGRELAAQRITAEELAELTAPELEMQAAFERRDLPSYYQLNALAHDLLSDAARNPALRETWKQVNGRMHAFGFARIKMKANGSRRSMNMRIYWPRHGRWIRGRIAARLLACA